VIAIVRSVSDPAAIEPLQITVVSAIRRTNFMIVN
jgi:hypothetical protein